MIQFAIAYVVGTAFGEVLLLTWWAMHQTGRVTPLDYLRQKWAVAAFSGTLALCGCILWAEGSLLKYTNDTMSMTFGYSTVSGAGITFFAHGIIWAVGKLFGLKPPPEGDATKGE